MASLAAKTVQTVVSPGSATYSDHILIDTKRSAGINIGFGCQVTGTLTYSVQHTFDETPTDTGVWYDHSDYITPKSVASDGNYAFGITAVRLINDTWTSGAVTMTVVQAGAGSGR